MIKPFKQSILQNTKQNFHELKERLLFLLGALIIFRIGSFIPIPGINIDILNHIFFQQNNTILNLFNIFSGGALSRSSIFVLGVMPYISASIILQILTSIHPKLIKIKKDGALGRKKINKYIKYTTLLLAIIQAIGISTGLPHIPGMENLVLHPGIRFICVSVLTLVTGTMFLTWLGNQITHRGIGNGISIMIVMGIISSIPIHIKIMLAHIKHGNLNFYLISFMCIIILLLIYIIVFIEQGQRKIIVHYAKQHYNKYMYSMSNITHLPLKINMAGVMPAIFSASILLFASTIFFWLGHFPYLYCFYKIAISLQPGKPLYILLYICTVLFFCFFYTLIIFNPKEIADNLKKTGAYIPGIRPGIQTSKYIFTIMSRLNFSGSLYISFICLVPTIIHNLTHITLYFGGTSLLIIVVVMIELIIQVQTIMISKQYDSIMKKINFKR
ncbi:preprotein translocase subunit SecY [Enterobacteriaceae endosymbiont of Macroplea appendiculata]|uniref:preprotein translocase subunit SecY n=1 Tax=Enterobacteriaceae endosymbiont of Macroplea appendiculata TaxID=2675790 RepID=UPI001448C409|nr:preprotein translocase subunit SecY [Enterobacteriaceae endosymbiont of Macroplea appendiculata]QJC30867.1 preprotein translocase subunit SecY [Enterobacteriaceae endosymbiont of Macroplea appendiculata]